MNKSVAVVITTLLALGATQPGFAEGKSENAAKPVSCKQQAKDQGLTDKKEIKAFVKECKKANKDKAEKKAEDKK